MLPHLSGTRIPLVTQEEVGESPIWPVLAVLTVAGLYAMLPTRFISGHATTGVFGATRWVVPGLALLLLVPPALTVPGRRSS